MKSLFPIPNNVQPDASTPPSGVEASEPSPFEATPSRQSKASSDAKVRKPGRRSDAKVKKPGRKRGRKSTRKFSPDPDYTGHEPIPLTVKNDMEVDEKICPHDLDENLLGVVIAALDRVHGMSENRTDDDTAHQNNLATRERLSLMSIEQLVEHAFNSAIACLYYNGY
ncbi:8507_t:CDS:2 [Paraglomus occultum]|uniref:8507_t:CDS:1 n=1 Tax=Paraglomus occultum TaxID=144539 RepID=A0A9N9D660_9GLOM|nr:8507_t:CDS:2 [Paraglomus occultum]